jgi:hypothetical protein
MRPATPEGSRNDAASWPAVERTRRCPLPASAVTGGLTVLDEQVVHRVRGPPATRRVGAPPTGRPQLPTESKNDPMAATTSAVFCSISGILPPWISTTSTDLACG